MNSNTYRDVELAVIREPAHQLRAKIDAGQLGELADSMAAEGLHQPVGLRGPDSAGFYEIVWGHRRFLAARLLEWPRIAARVFPPDYDPLLAAVSENIQRADLTPIEEGRACVMMLERGAPVVEVARKFRRSESWVRQRLALLELPEDLRAALDAREISIGVARVLVDIDHEPYRRQLVAEAHRAGATETVAEVWRAHYLADRDRIVRNELAIADITARREAWKIVVPCDGCTRDADYLSTRTWKLCAECSRDLAEAISAARASTEGGPDGAGS